MSTVLITHVYTVRGVVAAWVTTEQGGIHRIGHLPWNGWFCDCPRGKRCPQIGAVKALVPVAAIELGGANVKARIVPAGACVPPDPGRTNTVTAPRGGSSGPSHTPERITS